MISFFKKNWDTIAVFIVFVPIFCVLGFYTFTDIPLHANIAIEKLTKGYLFQGNFGIYFLCNLFSGFTGQRDFVLLALCIMIAFAVAAKYKLVKDYLKDTKFEGNVVIASISMLFVFTLPLLAPLFLLDRFSGDPNLYLGYYVPNVWHNSTIICCMPFAISVYFLTLKQFKSYQEHRDWLIALLLVISIIVKPSFFFMFVFAYPLCMLYLHHFTRNFWHSMIPVICGFIALGYEYVNIYQESADGSGVIIDLLFFTQIDFWKIKVPFLVVSFLFPVFFIWINLKHCKADLEFLYICIYVLTAILINFACSETGPRAYDGNFGWSVIPAMWFLYFYMFRTINTHGSNANGKLFVIFNIHVLFGVFYLIRILIMDNYY